LHIESPHGQVMNTEVLIVGAGPAGSSAAWHLAQLGVDVTLLDRAQFPRDKVCAEYLSPQASRILSNMGALQTIESAGATQLSGMKVRAPNGCEILGHFMAQHGFRGFRDHGLGIRRTILDAALVDCARRAGVHVVEEMQVTDLVRDTQGRVMGVQVRDTPGIRTTGAVPNMPPTRTNPMATLNAQLVIGADGLRSVVGRRLGLIRRAWWPKRMAMVAHYHGVTGISEVGEMHVEPDGYIGLADVGAGMTNVALVVPIAQMHNVRHNLSINPSVFFERWLMSHPQLALRFTHAEPVSDVRVTGPFATSARRAWAPGAALVGDAADFFDPFTGEGVYSALRGGELLAPLAADYVRAPSTALRRTALPEYERARRREFSGKWMVERIIGAFVANPALMNHAARALSRRTDMADLLIGVAGDFVPAREVLRFGYLARLLLFGI
jgi:flavin-dependent dehydrogenase